MLLGCVFFQGVIVRVCLLAGGTSVGGIEVKPRMAPT